MIMLELNYLNESRCIPNSTRAAPFACLLLDRNDIPIPDTPTQHVCRDSRVPGDENSIRFMEVGHPLCVGLQVHVVSAERI